MIDPRSDFNAHIDAPLEIDEPVDEDVTVAEHGDNASLTKV